jgi:hypothetical protein
MVVYNSMSVHSGIEKVTSMEKRFKSTAIDRITAKGQSQSGIRHQASGIRHQASGIRHQASGIRHQAIILIF